MQSSPYVASIQKDTMLYAREGVPDGAAQAQVAQADTTTARGVGVGARLLQSNVENNAPW
jgi:hypothetical protein